MRLPRTSDPLDLMLEYDRWGTERVLNLCRPLSREEFTRRFPIGPGTLHDTAAHIVACVRRWHDRIAGVTLRPSIDAPVAGVRPERSLDELAAMAGEACAQFAEMARACRDRADLGTVIRVVFSNAPTNAGTMGGDEYMFTKGAAIMHVLNHGTHHRAQMINMLRRMEHPGVSDALPDFDLVDWQYETECKA